MNALQNKMLEMLCEIDEICRKHRIEYCLFAGSGLGADRHKGFIPWDDDADIIMTLDNYEKLLAVFDSEAREGRVLNCIEKNIDYPFTYARYVDITTTAIQRHTAFGGCDPGIKIDIFVVVPTHGDLAKAEKHRMEIIAFSEVICPYAIMHTHRPDGYAEVYRTEKAMYDKWGREKYIRKRMPKLKNYKKKGTGRYALFSGMLCNSYLIDAEIMDEVEYVKFENKELPISKHNDAFSTLLYGEGWISKPENLEGPQHTYLLDAGRPYKEYLDILWKECDFDSTEQMVSHRRNMHIIERDQFKDVLVNNQRLRNLAVEMHAEGAYGRLSEECRNDWCYLYDLFSAYYNTQLKRINKVYKLFIPLNKETFTAAMNAAIMCDRYYEAADIMAIGEQSHGLPLDSVELKAINDRISICSDITKALYIRKDFEYLHKAVNCIADELVRESLTVKIAELWMKAVSAAPEEMDDICSMIDKCADIYNWNGELLAVKGYCLEKKDQIDEMAEIYTRAAEKARNGYLYQWLADKGYGTYEYNYE